MYYGELQRITGITGITGAYRVNRIVFSLDNSVRVDVPRANVGRGVYRETRLTSQAFPRPGAIHPQDPVCHADFSDFRSDSGQMSSRPVAFRLSSCFRVPPPQGFGPSVGRGQVRVRMWGRMEIRGVGAGPAVGIRRGEEFILFAAPVVSSEAESPRPEPPRRLWGLPAAAVRRGRQAPFFCHLFLGGKKR